MLHLSTQDGIQVETNSFIFLIVLGDKEWILTDSQIKLLPTVKSQIPIWQTTNVLDVGEKGEFGAKQSCVPL